MTNSLHKVIPLIALFIFTEAHAMDKKSCRAYLAAVETLRQTQGSAHDQVDLQLTEAPDSKITFDKEWFYLDLGDMILPVPEKPKKIKKQDDGTISISSENFTAVAGGNVLGNSLNPIESFVTKRKIHSDYDFNLYLFGSDFTKCGDIQASTDGEAKAKLATIKALEGPFEIKETIHAKNAKAISLAGPHRTNKKLVSNLIAREDAKSSHNILLYFSSPEQLAKFHSYLPKIRNRSFFKTGTLLTAP